jgi:hypothetical protein
MTHRHGKLKDRFIQRNSILDEAGKLIPHNLGSWEPGTYMIELKSKDAFGEEVEFKTYFTLYSPSARRLPEQQIWWSHVLTPSLEPGQKAKILIGSSVRLPVLYEIEVNGEIVSSERLRLNRRTRVIEIPVTEKHLGGFRVLFTSAAHNRAFAEAISINVPDKRKELKLNLKPNATNWNPEAGKNGKYLRITKATLLLPKCLPACTMHRLMRLNRTIGLLTSTGFQPRQFQLGNQCCFQQFNRTC